MMRKVYVVDALLCVHMHGEKTKPATETVISRASRGNRKKHAMPCQVWLSNWMNSIIVIAVKKATTILVVIECMR